MESARSPSNGSVIWSSVDEGETFQSHDLPAGVVVDDVTFHPKNGDWLLGFDRMRKTLYCSTNFAQSWRRIASNVSPNR